MKSIKFLLVSLTMTLCSAINASGMIDSANESNKMHNFYYVNDNSEIYEVQVQRLNVMAASYAKAKVLGTLEKGDCIHVVAIEGSWAKIEFNDSYGYVSINNLKKIEVQNIVNETVEPENDLQTEPTVTQNVYDNVISAETSTQAKETISSILGNTGDIPILEFAGFAGLNSLSTTNKDGFCLGVSGNIGARLNALNCIMLEAYVGYRIDNIKYKGGVSTNQSYLSFPMYIGSFLGNKDKRIMVYLGPRFDLPISASMKYNGHKTDVSVEDSFKTSFECGIRYKMKDFTIGLGYGYTSKDNLSYYGVSIDF